MGIPEYSRVPHWSLASGTVANLADPEIDRSSVNSMAKGSIAGLALFASLCV